MSEMVKQIAIANKKRVHLIKIFNPILLLLSGKIR